MAIVTKCGLTVADLKTLSLGFVLDICDVQVKLANGEDVHQDEEHYHQLKDVYEYMVTRLNNGTISKDKFNQFMEEYEELNEIYGD